MKNLNTYLCLRKNIFVHHGKRDRSDGHISDEQYLHLQNVWNIFNFNTLEDFHNHYLKVH